MSQTQAKILSIPARPRLTAMDSRGVSACLAVCGARTAADTAPIAGAVSAY